MSIIFFPEKKDEWEKKKLSIKWRRAEMESEVRGITLFISVINHVRNVNVGLEIVLFKVRDHLNSGKTTYF